MIQDKFKLHRHDPG